MDSGEHRCQFAVRHVLLAEKSVVAVLGEGVAQSGGRLVDPHEIVVSEDIRQGKESLRQKLRSLCPKRLRAEPLSGAVRTRTARVERGEAPLRHEKRLSGAAVKFSESVGETFGIGRAPHPHHVAVEIRPRIAVERHDVAIFPRNLPHDRMGAADPRKTCAQNKMVRVCTADRRRRCREVPLRGKLEEIDLVLHGRIAASWSATGHEAILRDPCRMGFGKFSDRVVKAGVEHSAPPPRKLVVDEISEEPRIIPVGCALPSCHMVAPYIELRVEHVRE